MIATMDDLFRLDLPAPVQRAQARINKVIVERRLPPRIDRLCNYLVATTSLKKGGVVHLSRAKVAGLLSLSERTIDRYFDILETNGVLERQVRDRTPGGFFYGTCVKWSQEVWAYLFELPARTRKEAVASNHTQVGPVDGFGTEASTPNNHFKIEAVSAAHEDYAVSVNGLAECAAESTRLVEVQEAAHALSIGTAQPQLDGGTFFASPIVEFLDGVKTPSETNQGNDPASLGTAIHATNLSHYTDPMERTISKKLILSKTGRPTFPKTSLRLPHELRALLEPLCLNSNQIRMLLAVAKKTDLNSTKTRLQDLLKHVGNQLIKRKILGESASKYLYRCLTNGEDYSAARFALHAAKSAKDGLNRDNPWPVLTHQATPADTSADTAIAAMRSTIPLNGTKDFGKKTFARAEASPEVVYVVLDPQKGLKGPMLVASRELLLAACSRFGFLGAKA